jgi:hypothetical protein
MKRTLMFAMVSPILVACSAEPQGEDQVENVELNLNPATFAEASESLASVERLMRVQKDDPRALDALEKLQPRLDELNHLVARVEASPGHVVSFYESEPGVIGVVEVGPQGEPRVLSASDLEEPLVPLYERLSGGAKAPQALVEANTRANLGVDQTGPELEPGLVSSSEQIAPRAGDENVGRVTQEWTEGEGQLFRDTACFKSGDFKECHPNRSNGAWFELNTRTSFMVVAPYNAPTFINVNLKYNGAQRFLWPVYQGDSTNFAWHSAVNGCGFFSCNQNHVIANHRWDLFEADGKSYHWTVAGKWGCTNQASCEAWPDQ